MPAAQATKEETPFFPLAAGVCPELAENSHRGHRLPTAVLYPGISAANSSTASGLQVFLYDEGRRSRSTGKERDAESGLDYFGARYMSSAQGRFTSADPMGAGAGRLADPQSWNLYAYARNNPLLYTDALGFNYDVCDADGKNCRSLSDAQYNDYLKSIQGSNLYVTPGGTINYQNENGSITKVGSATYYNERAENAAGFLNFTIGVLAPNYLSVLGPLASSLRAGTSIASIGLEGAAEAANTRALVAELSLMKPNVTNPKLAEIVNELFQTTDKLPGGTAGAVRWEMRTGELLSPKGHFQEAVELVTQLDRFLKNNPGISANDQGVAKELIRDLQNALGGK
jgi:RHS repeat-associated protein